MKKKEKQERYEQIKKHLDGWQSYNYDDKTGCFFLWGDGISLYLTGTIQLANYGAVTGLSIPEMLRQYDLFIEKYILEGLRYS